VSDSSLPPRKKNWRPGTWQIGLFVRTPDGSQVVSVWDDAPEVVKDAALKLLLERFPDVKELALAREKMRPARILPDLGDDDEKR
jgi:hypothetical protein